MAGLGYNGSDNTLTAPAPMTPGSLVTTATAGCLELHLILDSIRRDFLGCFYIILCKIARVPCVLLSALYHGRLVLLNVAPR